MGVKPPYVRTFEGGLLGTVGGTAIAPGVPNSAIDAIALSERVKLRLEGQIFDVFNHTNFGLPSLVLAGIPGKQSTQTRFGALTYPTSPPTGLLGVGLGGDSSPRMIAFQARVEF